MAAKPRLVLPDAGAVIQAHRIGAWGPLCAAYDVVVCGIIANEASFFIDDEGNRVTIDLNPDLASGTIRRYDASAADFAATTGKLPTQLRSRVDEGELEALTYLLTAGATNTAFLTADGAAIEATVVLGFSDVGMSLQRALQACGLTKALPYEHTEEFVREAKRRGGTTLVQFGMSGSSKKARG